MGYFAINIPRKLIQILEWNRHSNTLLVWSIFGQYYNDNCTFRDSSQTSDKIQIRKIEYSRIQV